MDRRCWRGVLVLLLAVGASGSPLHAQDIPPALQAWQGWVLHDVPEAGCPRLTAPSAQGRQCIWPGRLALQADANGGRFQLQAQADAPAWLALPGDDRHWPQQVTVDDQPQPVLRHDDGPALRLAPGQHEVRGALPWATRPATLAVPAAIALVSLSLDGKPVERIERNDDRLTLGEAAAAQRAADALSVRVYRRLHDGLPATLQTRLQLDVAGSAREQVLGPVLPAGFVATALGGQLPARIEPDGRLRVQLRPGRWTVLLDARATAVLKDVSLKLPAAPWPRREIWSYADDTALRGSRVEGHATDAAQAGVPSAWQSLPAFVLDATNGLAVVQGNRGEVGGQGDRLQLQRAMWLDFNGGGLTVADRLVGELRHRQRLDVAPPWQLQRAAQHGAPLLISKGRDGRSGVELRDRQLELDAGLRVAHAGGRLPAGAWQVPLERIDATLHLPPGYRLLGAHGADRSPDSWVAQWSLLDLFVVALIALLAGRALGWPWAALAAGFLALAQHEVGAPRWTLAVVLAVALLLRALPEGRLRLAARAVAVAAFALAVLWTLPFAANELQYALHPQLESGQAQPSSSMSAAGTVAKRRVGSPRIAMQKAPPGVYEGARPAPAPPPPPMEPSLANVLVAGSAMPPASVSGLVDSRAVMQAGAGTPAWDVGNDYRLGWSGPVTGGQSARLVIAPAWLVRLLRVLMVGLLAALLARLVPLLLAPLRGPWGNWHRAAATALLALALLPPGAHAGPRASGAATDQAIPSQGLLDELRRRLVEAPKCAPDCAQIASVQLQASADRLEVELDAQAGADLALPLPLPDATLTLLQASVDGRAATLAGGDGAPLLRLERGVHRVVLGYRIGAADTTSLRFPLRPGRATFAGSGWTAGGIDDGRLLGDSVALNRVRVAADGAAAPVATQSFPPYVRLTRRLVLGVDWTVHNVVERLAPADGGFSVSLPLLPGEHPLGEDAPVHDGRIDVTFRDGVGQVSWDSRLDSADALTLQAPALSRRAEVWELDSAPMWHVEASGVPTSARDSGLRFLPLPGERLQLRITRPQATAGSSLAVDSAQLHAVAGERATETTLTLRLRSTRGGEHAIALPPAAELLGARRDGELLNLAVRDGALSLPLLPGLHDYEVRLREPRGVAERTLTPALSLGAPVANIHLDLQLPQDRWVLWTWGPGMGPAVLYWSQLVVLLIAAWLLSRYAPTPLRFHHWLLLGLGFSAFAWSAYALVVVWLIALGLRARRAAAGEQLFNVLQIGLAVLTLLALAMLVAAVPRGLLGLPDMHVAGNGSSAWQLRWFADRSAGALPLAGVFSVSLWVYKVAMLAWALWLANALIGWLRWGFEAWSQGGYWRRRAPKEIATPPQLPPSPGTGNDAG